MSTPIQFVFKFVYDHLFEPVDFTQEIAKLKRSFDFIEFYHGYFFSKKRKKETKTKCTYWFCTSVAV